jgi:hypothetical protein
MNDEPRPAVWRPVAPTEDPSLEDGREDVTPPQSPPPPADMPPPERPSRRRQPSPPPRRRIPSVRSSSDWCSWVPGSPGSWRPATRWRAMGGPGAGLADPGGARAGRRHVDGGEDGRADDSLHPGEPLADADPGSGTEGEVGVPGAGRAGLLVPPLGAEGRGFRPPPLVVVEHPLAGHHQGVGGDPVAANLRFRDGLPPEHPCWRVQPHGLRQDHLRVPEARKVPGGREAVSEDLGDLGVQARLNPGFCDSRYHVQVRATAVVSCPARKMVMASSRTCSRVIPSPSPSASRARSSSDNRSSPAAPDASRASIIR